MIEKRCDPLRHSNLGNNFDDFLGEVHNMNWGKDCDCEGHFSFD